MIFEVTSSVFLFATTAIVDPMLWPPAAAAGCFLGQRAPRLAASTAGVLACALLVQALEGRVTATECLAWVLDGWLISSVFAASAANHRRLRGRPFTNDEANQ